MTDAPDVRPRSAAWRRLIFTAWLAYWVALTGLLLSPKVPRAPITISAKGLVAHFTTFAILAYLCVLARRAGGAFCSRSWALRWAMIFAAYGGATELLQPLSGRARDLDDFLADALGAGVVLLVASLRSRSKHPGSPR